MVPFVQNSPHSPQFPSKRSSSSQPSTGSPLQSPKPTSQAKLHAPLRHRGVMWGGVGQALPHVPQSLTLVLVTVSHPLSTTPSQLP